MSALNQINQETLERVALSVADQMVKKEGPQPGDIFPTAAITEMANQLESLVDCETLQTMVENRLNSLFDTIKGKIDLSTDLSPFTALLDIPTSPDDVVDWAKNFVTTYISPQIRSLIDVVIQLAQFIAALIDLAKAVATALTNVALCAIEGVQDAIQNVLDTVNSKIGDATTAIAGTLTTISTFQNKLVGITGGEAALDTSSAANLLTSVENGALDKLDAQTKTYRDGLSFLGIADLVTQGTITTTSAPIARVITQSGSNYSPGDQIVIISSGGTNANVEISTSANSVNQVTINNGGSGYSFSDVGYIDTSSGSGASLRLGLDDNYYQVGTITIYGSQAEYLASL